MTNILFRIVIIIIIIIIGMTGFFHTNVSRWFCTRDWVTGSLPQDYSEYSNQSQQCCRLDELAIIIIIIIIIIGMTGFSHQPKQMVLY